MYKLEPDDIQGMLGEAARVLTQPQDKEIMRRLVASTHDTGEADWDRGLIATMLAKAGKMHEAEMVVHDISSNWRRADALLGMSKALLEVNDEFQSGCVLHIAAMEASAAQDTEDIKDRLDASAVLLEVARRYLELGQNNLAKQWGASIADLTRKNQFEAEMAKTQAGVTAH